MVESHLNNLRNNLIIHILRYKEVTVLTRYERGCDWSKLIQISRNKLKTSLQ